MNAKYVYSCYKQELIKYNIMSTEKTKLYCIWGLIKAAQSSAVDKESHEALVKELKANHIPETINVITEESFHSIMAERCAPEFLSDVLASITAEYDEMEFEPSIEECAGCNAILKGGL